MAGKKKPVSPAEMKLMRYRHGDLVIDQITEIPASAEKTTQRVLVHGAVTGHSHRFDGEGVVMRNGADLYLRVKTGTVTHEEHGPIDLPMGDYRVTQKRQHTPDGWAAVQD